MSPIRADSYNVLIESCVLDIESSCNTILERPRIHMMRAVPFTRHQLLKYPTLIGMDDIRGDQVVTRTIATVARKKSG